MRQNNFFKQMCFTFNRVHICVSIYRYPHVCSQVHFKSRSGYQNPQVRTLMTAVCHPDDGASN